MMKSIDDLLSITRQEVGCLEKRSNSQLDLDITDRDNILVRGVGLEGDKESLVLFRAEGRTSIGMCPVRGRRRGAGAGGVLRHDIKAVFM